MKFVLGISGQKLSSLCTKLRQVFVGHPYYEQQTGQVCIGHPYKLDKFLSDIPTTYNKQDKFLLDIPTTNSKLDKFLSDIPTTNGKLMAISDGIAAIVAPSRAGLQRDGDCSDCGAT